MSAVATKQEILQRIQAHREEIRALGVEGLGLFGSFVRGEQGPESDVDLLVRFRPQEKTFDNFMAARNQIKTKCQGNLKFSLCLKWGPCEG